MKPLLHAFLAGLPLALVVAPLFFIAGAAPRLVMVGAALAFGIGAAFELLSTHEFWAKVLGGVVTVAVVWGVSGSWAAMSRLAVGPEPDQEVPAGSRVEATGQRAAPVRPLRGTTGAERQRTDRSSTAEAGYGPEPRSTGDAGTAAATRSTTGARPTEGASSPTGDAPSATGARPAGVTASTGIRTAAAEPDGGVTAPSTAASPLPATPEPTTQAEDQADGLPTTLRVRNAHDVSVEVRVVAPGVEDAILRLDAGGEAQLGIGSADPSRARITWHHDGGSGSIAWTAAVRSGAVFVLPGD